MIMKKLTAGLTLAALLTLPGLSVGASAVPVQPRLIPLTDFFRNPEPPVIHSPPTASTSPS